MRNGRNLKKLLTAILLVAPIIFLAGCESLRAIPDEGLGAAIDALEPEAPPLPEMEPVRFEDKDGGLWLSYNDYRALERNVIALHEHFAKLEAVIKYYREKR